MGCWTWIHMKFHDCIIKNIPQGHKVWWGLTSNFAHFACSAPIYKHSPDAVVQTKIWWTDSFNTWKGTQNCFCGSSSHKSCLQEYSLWSWHTQTQTWAAYAVAAGQNCVCDSINQISATWSVMACFHIFKRDLKMKIAHKFSSGLF